MNSGRYPPAVPVSSFSTACLQLPGRTTVVIPIFAAVMQELRWATVIGERSAGRTRIQETIDNGEDESYIEHVAREDYNYVKPEERVYYDSDD